jgi:hypothetical protein
MASSSSSEGACWSCGSPQAKRFCRSCGADSGCPSCGEIALGRFCRSCGFDVASGRAITPTTPNQTSPGPSGIEEASVAVDEEHKHLDSTELDADTSGLTAATGIAATIPGGPVGLSLVANPINQTSADDPSEPVDKPSPTRSHRKILIAAVAIVAVGLIASAVAFRGQGNEPQEASAASTSTSMEPVQTIPTTTTTTINPAELMAAVRAKCVSARDEEMLSQKTQLRSLGAVTSDPVEISADPLIWTYNVWTQLNGDRSLRGRVECQPDGSVVATYRPV